MAVRKKKNVR